MKQKGFTLIELIIALGIIAVLTGVSVPVFTGLIPRNDLEVAANVASQNLRRAQILAQAVDGDANWGVKLDPSGATLFKGVNYASRDPNFDEPNKTADSVSFSGLTEVVFAKFTGYPQTTGTITLTSTTNETRLIILNAKGSISY